MLFLTILKKVENVKLKLALGIPTGSLMKVANYVIEMLPHFADKTVKDLLK